MKISLQALLRLSVLSALVPFALMRAQDSVAIDQLRRYASPLSLEDGTLRGPGAAVLAEEARKAQFLLIGETHGFHEVPAFVAAFFELSTPQGYRHLAVEVGPFSAAKIHELAKPPPADSAFARFQSRFPYNLSFYMWRDEQRMAQRVVAAVPREREPLWGLDQEVMFAPVFLLQAIADSARPNDRRVADSVARYAASLHQKMLQQHNPMAVYMMAASDSEISAARRRLGTQPTSAAIFEEIVESRQVYQNFFSGEGWESNQRRSALMKRHFRAYYERAIAAGERRPKVMFKFGANHMMKGREITDTYDLGSLAHEIAVSNGSTAFNLLILVGGGTRNAWLPFAGGEAEKRRPFSPEKDDELSALGQRSLLAAAVDRSTWNLLDLRRLRPLAYARKLGALSPELERAIWAYDAVLVIPEGHPATLATDP